MSEQAITAQQYGLEARYTEAKTILESARRSAEERKKGKIVAGGDESVRVREMEKDVCEVIEGTKRSVCIAPLHFYIQSLYLRGWRGEVGVSFLKYLRYDIITNFYLSI
tara:strand:- start:200 stop:526 length:327 start_codon:yes stop_codon:yes gene_type:complete